MRLCQQWQGCRQDGPQSTKEATIPARYRDLTTALSHVAYGVLYPEDFVTLW